jgi:hypothetical protein
MRILSAPYFIVFKSTVLRLPLPSLSNSRQQLKVQGSFRSTRLADNFSFAFEMIYQMEQAEFLVQYIFKSGDLTPIKIVCPQSDYPVSRRSVVVRCENTGDSPVEILCSLKICAVSSTVATRTRI